MACGTLFAVIGAQVALGGPVREAEERLAERWRQPHPGAPAADDGLAEFAADLGHWYVAGPVLLLTLAGVYAAGRAPRPPLAALAATAAVPLLVGPLKALFDRPGPLGGEGYFPSGHAAMALVAYGGAALVVLPGLSRPRFRGALVAVAAVVVAAAGAGLVRRGYHWPLDVLASWCLGGLLLACVALAVGGRSAPREG
ncbi:MULTISPECIES: phosphatase PAP2 family protein [unclassified Streptomyces]|uniref:phosphatase PAP2 family protein n=1 Tax=unclassified Streptomyces TaxID=2593676 RepID=UPI0022B6AF9D|nr:MULTISPECIES: phosphatase PAP2 family protein [unclassified Streptomyces]MCZ7416239.1 phosphatase PAP2 family protein [Streptomyces sp. WMMC897]MCZ7433951.1 phosphatase PAP2 family protein [Streptomyces sp. WMMC1477]